jgi:hypothetical protein
MNTTTAMTVRVIRRAAVLAVVALWTRDARAQVTVSGSPAQMTVNTAPVGFTPSTVTDASSSYSTTTPGGTTHGITAQLDTPMPAGVTLTVTLAVSGTAASPGPVALNTTPQIVVTGLKQKINALPITYTLGATLAAGVVPLQTRQVTFTYITTP